ncbi:MAG: CPBP family glutamic-type intramembrane protease [Planctomycetota bacterium]|jgi:hypothetical protein
MVTEVVLSAAIVSLWPAGAAASRGVRRGVPLSLYATALALALAVGDVGPAALPTIGLYALASFAAFRPQLDRRARIAAAVALLALGPALALGLPGGFDSPGIEWGGQLVRFRFEIATAGFFPALFGGLVPSRPEAWRRILTRALPIGAGTVGALAVLALLSGQVRWAPAWRAAFPLWAWSNLLFTCVAEEVYFRCLVQRWLEGRIPGRAGVALAVAAAAIIFGAAHLGGGWPYALLAAAAGIGYGAAYL